jgi:CPA2 family monovalent cation:H+ antiporter-2
VLFFVSVGMLFDPRQLDATAGLALATLGVVVVGKPLAAFLVVVVLRYPLKTALSVAVALGQIGEFSFIVGTLGRQLGVLPSSASQALVVTAIVSITLNPLLYRAVEPLARRFTRSAPTSAQNEARVRSAAEDPDSAIVVGYGPVGRVLTRVLRELGITPVVIELNHETIAQLQRDGVAAVHGDAGQHAILASAGVARARAIIFSADAAATEGAVRAARELQPGIFVMARAAYASSLPTLEQAGASVALSSEVEVALSMTDRLLHELDASRQQLDTARERARKELTAKTPAA